MGTSGEGSIPSTPTIFLMRHGRATIPFGKYRGVRIRLLPNDYLSWLTTAPMMRDKKWKWLWDSLISELKFRGFNYEMAETADPPTALSPAPSRIRKMRITDPDVPSESSAESHSPHQTVSTAEKLPETVPDQIALMLP